jgi:hypothetical protein
MRPSPRSGRRGGPRGGPAALLVLAARGRAATLRGDIAGLLILAKGMRAAALYADPERVARARRRALRRATPKNVRFAFRRVGGRDGWGEPAERKRKRIRDEALLAATHPGTDPDVLAALERPAPPRQALPSPDGPGGYKARYLAWQARETAARRQLAQRGYDVTTAAGWSGDGTTDRANRYLNQLAAGYWDLPPRNGREEG